jgi:hypothetical protein
MSFTTLEYPLTRVLSITGWSLSTSTPIDLTRTLQDDEAL